MSPIVDASDPGRWSEPLDALFLSPHPDDVELFCGGTVAKLVARGRRVGIADLTRGELSSNGSPQQRREESLTAAKILGVTLPRPVLGIADGGIDDGDEEQVRVVVEVLRAARPTLLFAPLRRDRHPDHEAAGRLARRAAFLAGLSRYPAAGSPTRPRALVHYLCHRSVEPGFLVDVSGVMESRRKAIAAYASQFESAASTAATFVNRPGFVAGREARLVAFGAEVGVDYAEAFVLSSAVCVEDPVTAFGSIEERTP